MNHIKRLVASTAVAIAAFAGLAGQAAAQDHRYETWGDHRGDRIDERQQRQMRAIVRQGIDLAIMISTMLHSIAVGNLLPATTTTVAVDINPAVVTKLADRGSWQTVGLVMDAASFLRELLEELGIER